MRGLPRDAEFHQVADRVWVARHAWWDVNTCVVGGARGCVLVDTLWSTQAGTELRRRVHRLGAGDLLAAVNTHEHFDHTFGNAAFADLPVIAHETAAEQTLPAGEAVLAGCREDPGDPQAAEVLGSTPFAATTTFSSVHTLDLDDRVLELIHPGRGHTAGDLIALTDGVLLAGDLVEESAERDGVPGFGPECHPMDWPGSLDLVLQLSEAETLVVPGHGNPVGRRFVEDQRDQIAAVAETIRQLAASGVPVADALEAGQWPWPREELTHAVRRGYAGLPAEAKRLPLA